MDSKENKRFFNRELSWLQFNRRVLELSGDPAMPLLERLKFLAIAASNLDEFFMVRAAGLQQARISGKHGKDLAGLTPSAQLKIIYSETHAMMNEMHSCFNDLLTPALNRAGIRHRSAENLSLEQEKVVYDLFAGEIFPVVVPMALSPDGSFPLLCNFSLHLFVCLSGKGKHRDERYYAVIPLHRYGSRIVHIPSTGDFSYLLREEIERKYAGLWFPGYNIEESTLFRITRNSDFTVEEEEASDLVAGMEDVLEERKTGVCVRLEIEKGTSPELADILQNGVGAEKRMIFNIGSPLNLADFMSMTLLEGYDDLKAEPRPSSRSVQIKPSESMFDQIRNRSILLYHPYESFDPVIRFIEEAADDPETLAIKIVLYRTSADSPIIAALRRAAENGVNVTVLLELKARFDEARNINWARDLEPRGIQVIYGVKGFKTHAKICVVVRREQSGVIRYCHFATGNYNESTARYYGDVSYFTADPELGEDASSFFNALCGYSQPDHFNRISMAPVNLRERILELIDAEILRAKAGEKALIMAKLNSLVDTCIIEKLYCASCAGVEIRLNIRGICCLVPGIKGLSENISVTGIIDRNLEHARILSFHHGGNPRVFITSADWMPRNLDKRLEILVPVDDPDCSDRLAHILETHLSDTQNGWKLMPDGSYLRLALKTGGISSQEVFYREAVNKVEACEKQKRTRFSPHRSAGERKL